MIDGVRGWFPSNFCQIITNPDELLELEEGVDKERLAKKLAENQGAKIGHEYTLLKGFQVIYPEGTVMALDEDKNIKHVELNQEVTT
ncbi:hypothetical protein N657DRAFT_692233 [Parathielavia appendiculata]|uniref:Uncharacterized protein n=1 Tax=Parathielavia appendiculata TaxID=2587402 RepID=A0AAN6TVX7_9PEZI|nr:hypothetical protein N657DRAFT_692233 [Parathielavia appendiculata]